MTTYIDNKTELLDEVDIAVSEMTEIMTLLDEKEVNEVPYKDSWTAGQTVRHVVKSTEGLAKAMAQDGNKATRDPFKNVEKLKNTFLDFSTKMRSPDFIVPEDVPYDKLDIIKQLGHAFQELKKSVDEEDLMVIVKGLPFGDVTKWELLHFVLFHTQRHLHQLKKIHEALRSQGQ